VPWEISSTVNVEGGSIKGISAHVFDGVSLGKGVDSITL